MIVIDASALIELLVPPSVVGRQIGARIASETLHVPHIIDLEIASTLRTLERKAVISTAIASQALLEMAALALYRYQHTSLLPRIWQLRHNATPYDAAYIALAETLAIPLITCDAKFAGTPGHTAIIELIA